MNTKLSNLRALFEQYNIDGYLIPHSDEYQNEHTPDCAKRLEYITGFTGSNGITIIMKDNQYFWTDGRYKIQAQKEVPDFMICERDFDEVAGKSNVIARSEATRQSHQMKGDCRGSDEPRNDALSPTDNLIKIGYNPMLFTSSQIALFSKNLQLIPIQQDLIEAIWQDKPNLPNSPAYLYPIQYSGMDAISKLKIVRDNFINQAKYALITEADSICWLLNIRGADIESVPVILGYLIMSGDDLILFTDISKIPDEVKNALPFVQFKRQDEIFEMLKSTKDSMLVDPISCSLGLQHLISNKIEAMNPCLLPKACKNYVEIECMKQGHIKDAVALCTGLAWVQNNRGITEHDVSLKLTELRRSQEGYVMNSFPTIAGFRENGAIIHYRAPEHGSKVIEGDGMLLIDSGAHYLGCTTDVTRVLVFGTPTNEQKRRYTQVLKGHIAMANARVPVGTFGGSLDVCARQYLWSDGVDYVHGTGHGVGNMLSVHEYPRYIWSAKMPTILKEGMVVSDEPGFYKEGEFGIRIENLLYVKKSSYEGFLEFEMLTLVPYSRDLIDISMLTLSEKEYLMGYYQRIRELVLPLLEDEAKAWCEYEIGLVEMF